MSQHRTLDYGDQLPPSFLDQIQEFISTMASANFSLTQASSTAIRVVAGTGNDQVSIGINGRWRYITGTITRSHPGGGAGTYDVYVVATDNVFTPTGSSPPETDDTDYAFSLRIVASGSTPSGSGSETLYRKIGTVAWNGTAITGVTQTVGSTLSDGTVTTAKLDSGVPILPIGGVIDWPWDSTIIPSWAAMPYGQSLVRANYTLLSTTAAVNSGAGGAYGIYGAADGLHFNLPDYRGRVSAGKDDMGGSAALRITAAISGTAGTLLGAAIGSEGVTLTTAQIPAHNHPVTGSPGFNDPGHSHGGVLVPPANDTGGSANLIVSTAVGATSAAFTGITVDRGNLGTSNAGGGGVHLNVQPTIVVNKIMRLL